MPARAVFLLTVIIASLPVCFVRPFFGILAWTVVAFLNPQSFLWDAGSIFPWGQALAIPTLAGMVVFSRGWNRRILSAEVLWIAVLWIWFTTTAASD